ALDDVLLVQPAAAAPPGGRAPVAPRAGHRRRAAEPAARASAAHGEDGAAVEVDAELVVIAVRDRAPTVDALGPVDAARSPQVARLADRDAGREPEVRRERGAVRQRDQRAAALDEGLQVHEPRELEPAAHVVGLRLAPDVR